ncbi:MAG: hypothetical protein NXI20_05665 [bacterium]|nr:hypothetical protein [bacterium]
MWFKKLTGFNELSAEFVRDNLKIEGDSFVSKANDSRFAFGSLQVPTLGELKKTSPSPDDYNEQIQAQEIIADVQQLHRQEFNRNAVFQAASQFNLLEMVGPHVSPDQGIDGYELDRTQGPACAIACGAGTIYRNYFVDLGSQIGQTNQKQIDCLDLIGGELRNDELKLWEMQNGYAMVNQQGLLSINKTIASLNKTQRELLKEKLKVGIQWDTEVTISSSRHRVTQVYCSALPVAYCEAETIYWEYFSRLILEATYEATLYASLINYEKTGSNQVYLTLVGGGVFGNDQDWILDSLQKALIKFKSTPLSIKVVSYGRSNANLVRCLDEI